MRDDPVDRLRRLNPHPRTLPAPDFALVRERIVTGAGPGGSEIRHPVPGRWLRFVRTAPLLAGVAIAVVIAAAAIALVAHRGTPNVGWTPPAYLVSGGVPPVPGASPQNQPALRLINAYERSAMGARVCDSASRPAHSRPTPDRGTPGPQVLRSYGVLRRPPKYRPRTLPPGGRIAGRVFVRYARIARRVDHLSFIVYPALSTLGQTPAACARALYAAVTSRLSRAPAGLRSRIHLLAYEQLLDSRYQRRHPEVLCLGGSGGGGCETLLRAESEGMIGSGGSGVGPSNWSYVVPDGAASITAHYPAEGPKQGLKRHIPSTTVTAKVVHNVAVWTLADQSGEIFPTRIVWRAKDGHVIRTVYSP